MTKHVCIYTSVRVYTLCSAAIGKALCLLSKHCYVPMP